MPKMPFSKAELEEFLDGLSPEEKSAFWQRFNQWIYEGAQAQGALSAIGAVLGLGALYAFVLFWIELGWNSWYFVLIIPILIGVWSMRLAGRIEAKWRDENPFELNPDE